MRAIKFTDEDKIWIINEFNKGIRLWQIAEKYNCDYTVIRSRLKKWINYKSNYNLKFNLNENYFETINTPNKAYFLGLMYSDGCVREGKKRSKQLMICLQEGDENVLRDFIKELKFTGDLYFNNRTDKTCSFRGNSYKSMNFYKLHVSSTKLCNDLIKLGCIPRKSLALKFPTEEQVSKEFLPYFILGLLDGDGWASIDKNGHVSVGFTGTYHVLEGIRNFLHEKINFSNENQIKNNIGCYRLCYGGKKQLKKFFNLVYKDINIFINRKKDKFLTFC